MSPADLLIAPQLAFLAQTPHANMVAWLARMEARPSLLATTCDHVAEMAKAA